MYEVKKDKNIWSTNVDGYEVAIKNETKIMGLYIGGKLQDVYLGMATIDNIRLKGITPTGKKIKAVIGGDFKLRCYLFVDNECIFEDK